MHSKGGKLQAPLQCAPGGELRVELAHIKSTRPAMITNGVYLWRSYVLASCDPW